MGKYDEAVYHILSDPVTPTEVAKKIGITQKTAQQVLMHLALTRENVKYKSSGRIHIFWKERENQELTGSLEDRKKNLTPAQKTHSGKCKEY